MPTCQNSTALGPPWIQGGAARGILLVPSPSPPGWPKSCPAPSASLAKPITSLLSLYDIATAQGPDPYLTASSKCQEKKKQPSPTLPPLSNTRPGGQAGSKGEINESLHIIRTQATFSVALVPEMAASKSRCAGRPVS